MSNFIQRDLKRRKLYKKYELKRIELLNIRNDSSFSNQLRSQCITLLNKLPRNSSPIRMKNRCILTGRGHGVYRFCRLSRIKFRELAGQGQLNGVLKSSW